MERAAMNCFGKGDDGRMDEKGEKKRKGEGGR
jgi:hypothetical protein